MHSMGDLEGALLALDPGVPRAEWVIPLIAFKAGGGSSEVARDWSARADNFTPEGFAHTWRSIKPCGGVTEKTLFKLARKAGWSPGNNLVATPSPRPRAEPPTRDLFVEYAKPIYDAATANDLAVASHRYCQRKQITHAFGARRAVISGRVVGKHADCILVPNRDWLGQLVGVEAINPEGKKQTWGRKGILILGMPEDSQAMIHVCEGWGTAYALSQMFPRPFACIVTFGKAKLEAAAQDALDRYQNVVVIHHERDNIDAWDRWAAGEGDAYVRKVLAL